MSQNPQDTENDYVVVDRWKRPWRERSNIIGHGIRPRNGAHVLLELKSSIGSYTDEDPAIIYTYDISKDPWFGDTKKREIIQKELKDVCRVTKMQCIIIRKSDHDKTVKVENGQVVFRTNQSGVQVPVYISCPDHLTVFLGRNFEMCLLEGHIYTRRVFKTRLGCDVLQIKDKPENTRWDRTNLEPIELWLTSNADDLTYPHVYPSGRGGASGGGATGGGGGGGGGGGTTGGGRDRRGGGNRGVPARAAGIAAGLTGAGSPAANARTTNPSARSTGAVAPPPATLVTPRRAWTSGPRPSTVQAPQPSNTQQQQQQQQQQPLPQPQPQPQQQQQPQLQPQPQWQPQWQSQPQQQPGFPAYQTNLNPGPPGFVTGAVSSLPPQPQFSYGQPVTSLPDQTRFHTINLMHQRVRSDIPVADAELRAANRRLADPALTPVERRIAEGDVSRREIRLTSLCRREQELSYQLEHWPN